MFTGLIEELGRIRSVRSTGGGKRFTIEADKVMQGLSVDDSVSVNGACQTVVSLGDRSFEVEAVEETLRKTTLDGFTGGRKVNLERAATLSTRMGGHLVQGHVDCTGTVSSVEKLQGSWQAWIRFPDAFSRYVVPAGSICIDGISLTAARVEQARLMVAIIPHTLAVTTLGDIREGLAVNLEFDVIGKYVEKMLAAHLAPAGGKKNSLEEMLKGL